MLKSVVFSSLLHIIVILLIFINIDNNINKNQKPKEIQVNIIEEKIEKKPVAKKKPKLTRKVFKTIPTKVTQKMLQEELIPPPPMIEKPKKKNEEIVVIPKKKQPKKIIKEQKEPEIIEPQLEEIIEEEIIEEIKDIEEYDAIDEMDISGRVKSNLKLQITRCYKKHKGDSKKLNMDISVNIGVSIKGIIDYDDVVFTNLIELSKLGEEELDKIKRQIVRAFKDCSPLRNLPEDKYEVWRQMNIKFKY